MSFENITSFVLSLSLNLDIEDIINRIERSNPIVLSLNFPKKNLNPLCKQLKTNLGFIFPSIQSGIKTFIKLANMFEYETEDFNGLFELIEKEEHKIQPELKQLKNSFYGTQNKRSNVAISISFNERSPRQYLPVGKNNFELCMNAVILNILMKNIFQLYNKLPFNPKEFVEEFNNRNKVFKFFWPNFELELNTIYFLINKTKLRDVLEKDEGPRPDLINVASVLLTNELNATFIKYRNGLDH